MTSRNSMDISATFFDGVEIKEEVPDPQNPCQNPHCIQQNTIISSILNICSTILQEQTHMKSDLNLVLQKLDSLQGQGACSNKQRDLDILRTQFPIKRVAGIEGLDKELENPEIRKMFCKKISSIGGYNLESFLLNVSRQLFHDKLLSKYSLCGKKGKNSFKTLDNILHALMDGINMHPNFNVTLQNVHEFYGRYLRNAPSRLKKSK